MKNNFYFLLLTFFLQIFSTAYTQYNNPIVSPVPSLNGKSLTGDPLPEAITESFFTGSAAGDEFGRSVSDAGDVNGDGYDDVIVGATLNDAGGSSAGQVYIYYGGNAFNNFPDIILTGTSANDNFGWSVSASGDVNADGYDDIVVGAIYNDAGGIDAGRAYLFLGGSSMDNVPDVIFTGAGIADGLGYSVSGAGDVNGDGYADLIIGIYQNNTGGNLAGSAHIFFGGAIMDNVPDVILIGAAAGDYFGISVSGAGDVNGDGFSDVIAGAYYNDAGGVNAGRAYIYLGGTDMNNIADVILTGEAATDEFGRSVSNAGDVNGDNYDDVIIGARSSDAGGTNAGRAYIYFGNPAMDNIADVVMTGSTTGDNFGLSVSGGEDINGDGYYDVIAGAYLNDAGGSSAGRVSIYLGGPGMDNITDIILTGAAADNYFGWSVSGAGDFNSDGYSDILVGAYGNDEGGTNAGRAYLYINKLTGADLPDAFFTGNAGYQLGFSVSEAGDVNGDNYPDIIIGAPWKNDFGGAYIYYGGPGMDNLADVTLNGDALYDNFGTSVSTAGDVNGDGFDDVIVGAVFNDAGGSSAGRAYVYFGGASMNNLPDVIFTGAAAGDRFGSSVSTTGDVNGDGYSDVIVGATQNSTSGTESGSAYIFFGGSVMNNIADLTLTGTDAYDHFGVSTASAGDVNGDGYPDVIVSAVGSDPGKAYLFYGGISMDATADIFLTGTIAGGNFGYSVSSAGDVNGDGYSDVIVGAVTEPTGGLQAGAAYIFYGGAEINNTPDISFIGGGSYNLFGYSVASAGDVNGDDYDDVIIAAKDYHTGTFIFGRVYIYFGGSLMDNTADIIMTGPTMGDFGKSVSSTRDVNGDGYDDVIVGADGDDAGGTNSGRTYLYLSSPPSIQPHIMSVKDIPLDQGGYVRIRWNRSGYDVPGQNRISEYILQRSDPPGSNGYVWDYVASIPAIRASEYSYVSSTPGDSSSNSSGTFYFRVIAHGTNPDENWYSNISSGHSVDNLSPVPPMNFYAIFLTGDVKLGWKANTEGDFKNYLIYRTDDPAANPDTLEVFAQVFDTVYIDTYPLSGTSFYYLKAQDVHNNLSPCVSASISAQAAFALTVSINSGWNMVSIPGLHPDNQNVTTWWPGKNPSAGVFKFLSGYQSVTTVVPGTGYWMNHLLANIYNTGDEWPANGILIVPHNPIPCAAGWNLIGGYEQTVQTSEITTTPPGIQTGSVFKYSGGYTAAAELNPGYGYWINLISAGAINIPDPTAGQVKTVAATKGDLSKIVITDNSQKSYTLYAATGEIDLSQFDLPPLPPKGMFDIRYSSQRYAERLNTTPKAIVMQGVEYPVKIKTEQRGIILSDETGKEIARLKSGEEIIISLSGNLFVTENIIPEVYALEQNYPNPFNPSTTIQLAVPEDVKNIKLTIYSALGEKVAELVNTGLQAGIYKYNWNASDMASGMYIYQIVTENFISTKKMLLLK